MILDTNLLINSLLLLYKTKANKGYVPKIISGKEIYKHYNFYNKEDTNYFFNKLCYIESVLIKNPGEPISSDNWIDNNYGLRESYLTQIRRECKIEAILG